MIRIQRVHSSVNNNKRILAKVFIEDHVSEEWSMMVILPLLLFFFFFFLHTQRLEVHISKLLDAGMISKILPQKKTSVFVYLTES